MLRSYFFSPHMLYSLSAAHIRFQSTCFHPAAFQCLSGAAAHKIRRLRQELCLFRQMCSGSAANFLFRIRQNPIPDSVPCIIFSGVRRIYPPGNPFFLEKAFYFCLSSFQKRTDNHAFPFRLSHRANPCHSVQTSAAEHVKQKRLRAVVPMMRHRNCTVTTAHLL